MIPHFNQDGLLPQGIHQSSLDELQERFSIFDHSDQRSRVFEGLKRLAQEASGTAFIKRIIIGGSFVTAKAEPNDFDCILVLDPSIVGMQFRPFEYNLISRRMARRMFGGNVLAALEDSTALQQYLKFFQTTRDGQPMGIVEIVR